MDAANPTRSPRVPEDVENRPVETVREPDVAAAGRSRRKAYGSRRAAGNSAVPALTEEKNGEDGSPRIDTPAPFAIRWGMPLKLTWKDTDEIAYALIDAHPDQDPLKLSFPKLHKMVIELEDFGDDPDKSSESILESIQMAWYEEVK